MVPPKLKQVKPFLLLIFDLYTPQFQKKAVLSHVSVSQLEAICEIVYNIITHKDLILEEMAKKQITKKKRFLH